MKQKSNTGGRLRSVSAIAKSAVRLRDFEARDVTGDGIAETWCNYFVNHVAQAIGCKDFRPDPNKTPMLANIMIKHMESNVERWQELECDEAQNEANFGNLVIAGWINDKGLHGHVNIIIPGALTWSKQFNDDVPNSANVGTRNYYGRPVSYGFRSHMVPRYWVWLKPKQENVT